MYIIRYFVQVQKEFIQTRLKLASSKKKVMITSHVQGVCTIKYDDMLAAKFTTKKHRPRPFYFSTLNKFPFLGYEFKFEQSGK